MLEFIVLGEIPGTSIQLTFWQLIELMVLFGAITFLWFERRQQRNLRDSVQELINRLAL